MNSVKEFIKKTYTTKHWAYEKNDFYEKSLGRGRRRILNDNLIGGLSGLWALHLFAVQQEWWFKVVPAVAPAISQA